MAWLPLLAQLPRETVRTAAWLIALLAVFVPLERIFALHRQRMLRRAFASDVLYYFLSNLLPRILLIVPLSALAWTIHQILPGGPYPLAASLPLWARLTGAQIVGECGAYWGHRLMHRIPALWRFHAVHHSAEEMDWLVNTRAHPLDILITKLCELTPMYLLGLAQPQGNAADAVPVLVVIVGSLWSFFIHANLNWRFGWLEWLISTPGFHHWHHTRDPRYADRNFAPLLPWVDAIFGTLYLPAREWPDAYGTDTPVAGSIGGQLLDPFTESRLARDRFARPARPAASPAAPGS